MFTKEKWEASHSDTLGWIVSSEERYPIARLSHYPEAEANASHIVDMQNKQEAFEAMEKALEKAAAYMGEQCHPEDVLEEARQALKLARGE